MKYMLLLLTGFTSLLFGQPVIPITIIDDHVVNYESTTFKICFGSNSDLKSLTFVDYLSSIERPDLQAVLEEFYLSPKFQSRQEMQNKCIFSTAIQVNSKYENLIPEKIDCQNFKKGTFIYGKTNPSGTIVRRNAGQQIEISQEGIQISDINWTDECNFSMTSPNLLDTYTKNNQSDVYSEILAHTDNRILLVSHLQNERHFLEMIMIYSPDLAPEKSYIDLQLNFNGINTYEKYGKALFKDAIVEKDDNGFKYLNFIIDLKNIQNINTSSAQSEFKDVFYTYEFPYATFRLISSKITEDKAVLTGIFSILGTPHPITFSADIRETKELIQIKSEQITLNLKDFEIFQQQEIKTDSHILSFSFFLHFSK